MALASLTLPARPRVISFADRTTQLTLDPRLREAGATGVRNLRYRGLQWRNRPHVQRAMHEIYDDMADAGREGADVIVHHAFYPAHEIAERLGIPAVPVCPHPTWIPTRSFTYPALPFQLPPSLNRLSYRAFEVRRRSYQGDMDAWRSHTLGLPPRRKHHDVLRTPDGTPATVIHPFSRHILPSRLDYPDWVHTTGFWFDLPADPAPLPEEVEDFLARGEPPVYIGFGSSVGGDPRRTGRIVTEAVRRAGVRAVVVAGWGGIEPDENADDILFLREAPLESLFPRMAAIVHHCGIGTFGLALMSGRPQVGCPYLPDHRFFARRAHAAGVAVAPIPQHRLAPKPLAQAITQAVSDPAIAARARELAPVVRAEDGVRAAAEIVLAAATT
ncbi:glycosyltransferase [Jiangella alkaliphila]|nr:glycosyltransferase [Jiangella alkaliphila]